MFKRKSSEIIVVDCLKAEELLQYNVFEEQRSIKPRHLATLEQEIINGTFLTGSVALAVLKYNNDKIIMVNGQHQCTATINVTGKINVLYEIYECYSEEDLSLLYQKFDNHRSRSLNDCLIPEAAALGIKWKKQHVGLVVKAACLKENLRDANKADKVKLLKKYIRHGKFINDILIENTQCKHLKRASVVYAMMDTWAKDKDFAAEFWANVRDGIQLKKDSPELKLRNYLMSCVVAGGGLRAANRSTNIATYRELYVKCIHAWNAKRKGACTALKYTNSAPLPKVA